MFEDITSICSPAVKLQSDFYDYYDYMFDREGIVWKRMSIGMDRTHAFMALELMGLQVPRWGPVESLPVDDVDKVVVYTDPASHRGEGKVLVTARHAKNDYPAHLASVYITNTTDSPASLRYLRIGHQVYYLQYQSNKHEWRSNCGVAVNITTVLYPPPFLMHFRDSFVLDYPMIAIDFVQSREGLWGAVDLNTAPGLYGTPVADTLSPTDVVQLIKHWVEDIQCGNTNINKLPTERPFIEFTQQ